MSRRGWAGLICAVSALLGFAACTSDTHAGVVTIKTADAYSAAIRWYLATVPVTPVTTDSSGNTSGAPGPIKVYVASESGKPISSEVQVSVVAAMADMKDVVTVVFADVRDDALDVETDTKPVKDNAVLLLVGDVVEGRPPVEVKVSVYHDIDNTHAFVMKIVKSGDSFRATSVTEVEQG